MPVHDNARRGRKRYVKPPRSAQPPKVSEEASSISPAQRIVCAAIIGLASIWFYWPVLRELAATWNAVADYSHGWLVFPGAAFLMWSRRASLPALSPTVCWGGLGLIAAAAGLRLLGSILFIESFGGWSIPLWIGGCVWLLGGAAVFRWSLPALAFLFFMTPIPFRLEQLMSMPMQRVATTISCWLLVALGQPAVAEGNVIFVKENQLEIAQACSGLRMLISITALAYVYCVLSDAPRWKKGILVASVAPIAIAANSLRITATGVLFDFTSGETAHRLSHDLAGWFMIPVAAVMMGAMLWYLDRLIIEERAAPSSDLLNRGKSAVST